MGNNQYSRCLWELFTAFMKIGFFTFGGGYAMIPIIQYNCVEKKKWITHDDMMNAVIIAESTPGPIAINCATFVGYRQAGFAGAVTATLGVVLPSFLVIYGISMCLDHLLEFTVIANAFKGIKAGVGLLILDAGFSMAKKTKKSLWAKGVMVSSAAIMLCVNLFSWDFSSISLILTVALASLAVFFLGGNSGHRENGGFGQNKDSCSNQKEGNGSGRRKDSCSIRKEDRSFGQREDSHLIRKEGSHRIRKGGGRK